ncbi:MAG: ABC transporter permease, partial [Phycisphaerae bacterium]
NKYGIYSELIADLLKRGQQERQQARRYYQQRRYDAYADAVRRARGFVTAAYPLIKDLEKDTVKGIVLYFALLIPFAFFCERLLFGFVDIKKQILANAGIFVTVFAIMRIVHPAFMVSKSPYVIFLAFIILALAVIVLWLIVGKFNEQMAQLKRASSRIHHTDVGRLSATYAAVMLGISNMRKRRLRTFLTTVTLVLITYAVLSFTSLSSYTHFFELPVEASPSYQGALVRDRMWQPLSRQWIQYVHAAFAPDNAVLAPRSWVFIEQENTLSQPVRHHRIIRLHPSAILSVRQAQAAAASSNLEALLLTAGGATVAWPRDDQTDACVMTQALAERLGLQQEDVGMATVRIAGQDLLLVGILASPSFDGVTLQPSSQQARPSASTRLALFVSPALLERLGPTRQVRLVPDQRARQSGFAAPAAAELLSTASPPAVVKLGLANVAGFVGMTSLEPQVSHIDRLLVAGRWLSSRYAPECVLPDSVARQLNITADQVEAGQVTVRTLGTDWKVVGLLDTDRLRTFFDLDGGQISPLEPRIAKPGEATGAARIREQEARAQVSTELREFKHIDPSRVVFATFERLNDLGGQIRCIAVGFRDMDQGRREVRSFLERSNALVFWADAGRTEALTSMGRTGVSGLGDLLVPILIGAFIIVNTMMGSVYERHREIGVYSSVGLAPVHVSALFIAESFVYAVMGASVGYLVGQVSAKVMMSYQVAGVELNYSSASTMLATLLVMGVVLLSAIYPSRIASQMAVPDVTRRWVLTEPQGDHWYFRFPFTVATQ